VPHFYIQLLHLDSIDIRIYLAGPDVQGLMWGWCAGATAHSCKDYVYMYEGRSPLCPYSVLCKLVSLTRSIMVALEDKPVLYWGLPARAFSEIFN